MDRNVDSYEPRYLAGILFFNARDFFEAHEVWESLWQDCTGPERRFYQGLIQAAVALYHFGNGNVRGAGKLYRSSREYMERYGSPYLGLNTQEFWQQMERCFAEVLAATDLDSRPPLEEALIPTITLEPPPAHWPYPTQFVEEED